MITKRIIPCLDVRNGRVVKGVNFEGLRDVSDPVALAEYYSNNGADELVFYDITASFEGRQLFTEIGMIEEQHVTLYGGLKDTNCTWFEELLMHEYTECYLYYSCYQDESDERIKKIWLTHFEEELGHLKIASDILKKYEGREWEQLFVGGAEFPSRRDGVRA